MIKEEDFVAEDFVAEDWMRESRNVPLIELGDKWKVRSPEEKIKYLIKLASSLNHACQLIQKERNELNELCAKKEAQIEKLHETRLADRKMIHTQIEAENQKQQILLEENQRLHAEIEQLRKGNGDIS
jgi:hypothetical protein